MLKSAPSRTTVLRSVNVFRTLRVVLGSTRHCILGRLPACIHSLALVKIDLLFELELELELEEDDDDDDEVRAGDRPPALFLR